MHLVPIRFRSYTLYCYSKLNNTWGINFNLELYPFHSFTNTHYLVFLSIDILYIDLHTCPYTHVHTHTLVHTRIHTQTAVTHCHADSHILRHMSSYTHALLHKTDTHTQTTGTHCYTSLCICILSWGQHVHTCPHTLVHTLVLSGSFMFCRKHQLILSHTWTCKTNECFYWRAHAHNLST